MDMISVAAFAARCALATLVFSGHIALTAQLRRSGLNVSDAVCRDSRRVFALATCYAGSILWRLPRADVFLPTLPGIYQGTA